MQKDDDAVSSVEIANTRAPWTDPGSWARPSEREPWARVCLACLECVQEDHTCDTIGVFPDGQKAVIIVAMNRMQDVFKQRARWLNDVALELASNLTVARACIQVLQDEGDDEGEGEGEGEGDRDVTGLYIGEVVGDA